MSEAADPFKVPWRIRDPIYVILASNALAVVLGLLTTLVILYGAAAIRPFESAAEVRHFLMYLIHSQAWGDGLFLVQEFILLLFISLFITRRYGVKASQFWVPGQLPQDVRLAVRMVFFGLMIGLAVVVSVIVLVQLVMRISGGDPQMAVQTYLSGLERESKVILSPEISWMRIAIVTLVAPPVEELLYRGGLYAALRKRMGAWGANALSSGLFALSHIHLLFGLPNVLVIGVLGGYIYERSKSLVPCILFHMLWNLFCAAPVKPELWPMLFILLGGLYLWANRGRSLAVHRLSRFPWKVYAVAFTLVVLLSSYYEPNAWVVLIELPACAALLSFAWKKRIGSPGLWRSYLYVFLFWSLFDWLGVGMPQEIRQQSAAQILSAGAFFIALTLPPLLVLARLSRRPPAQKDS